MAPENRRGKVAIVAIAVIKREGDKPPPAFRESLYGCVKRNQIIAHGDDKLDHVIQEFWRDLQQSIGLKAGGSRGPDMVESKDGAFPSKERRQHSPSTANIKRAQNGSDQIVTDTRHREGHLRLP